MKIFLVLSALISVALMAPEAKPDPQWLPWNWWPTTPPPPPPSCTVPNSFYIPRGIPAGCIPACGGNGTYFPGLYLANCFLNTFLTYTPGGCFCGNGTIRDVATSTCIRLRDCTSNFGFV